MSTSSELTAQVGTAVEELNTAKNRFEAIREETEQKVQAATAAVPGMLSLTLYVDASSGSDETGTGSSSMPFKTIKKAVESTVPICRLAIVLRGSSAEQKHMIDETIHVGSRVLAITYGGQHISLADNLKTVFICYQSGVVEFSDSINGNGIVYAAGENKLIMLAKGKAALHIGGYYSLTFCIDDNTSLTLMQANYRDSPRGFSEITLSRLHIKTLDASAPANAPVRVFFADHAGSVFYNVWQSQLGNNSEDSNVQSISLAGSSKIISS